MTRFICSIATLLIFSIGVMSFDIWANMLNIPDDELENTLETGLLPARQIRTHECNCTARKRLKNFGFDHYPRHLVSNECEEERCTRGLNECVNLEYTIDVSVFQNTYNCAKEYPYQNPEPCYQLLSTTPKTISVACIPVPSKRLMQSREVRP